MRVPYLRTIILKHCLNVVPTKAVPDSTISDLLLRDMSPYLRYAWRSTQLQVPTVGSLRECRHGLIMPTTAPMLASMLKKASSGEVNI